MDYSWPGSSIHGIFQARALEWGAILLIPTHIHTEACINHYFLTKYRVLVLVFINNVHELNNKKKHNSRITYKYLLNISLTPLSCRTYIWVSVHSWSWLSFGSVSPWHPCLLLIKDSNSQLECYIHDFKFSVSALISYTYRDEFAKNTTNISWPCIVPTF